MEGEDLRELRDALISAINSLRAEDLEGMDNVIVFDNDEYQLSLIYK